MVPIPTGRAKQVNGSIQHIYSKEIAIGETCSLLGIAPTVGHIYFEVINEDNAILYEYDVSDTQLQAMETQVSKYDDDLPSDLVAPHLPTHTKWLDHTGLRWRGIRETDRVAEWVLPLTVMEKMQILSHLPVDLSPMQLLGVAESHVLSEVALNQEGLYFVCRRLRLAYALAETRHDENGPYDYDTILCHVAHFAHAKEDVSWETIFTDMDHTLVKAPLDCMIYDNKLYISDSGAPSLTESAMCSLHVWQIS